MDAERPTATRNRPTVARDTRLLLAIILISVALLWILARVRFPDRPSTPNPVPPVLAQLAPPSAFDDIVAAVVQVESRLRPSVVAVAVKPRDEVSRAAAGIATRPALRFRDDLALVLVPAGSGPPAFSSPDIGEVGWDRASRLAVIRAGGGSASEVTMWAPRRLASPRFVIVADASDGDVSLQPVFVGSLAVRPSPIWAGPVWVAPSSSGLPRGALVFNADGAWAGLAAEDGGDPVIVPAERVLALAEGLIREAPSRFGSLGIEVQPLTPALAAATDAATGVIVVWVDPLGPAARQVVVGDAIEAIDGKHVPTLDHWTAYAARLSDGQSVALGVRRRGATVDVSVIARAATQQADRPLGLTFRTVPRVGAAVVRVDSGSAASDAGLRVGDVITLVGDLAAPSAEQASRAFATATRDRPMLVGMTRDAEHHVLALTRTW